MGIRLDNGSAANRKKTIVDLLHEKALNQPDQVVYTFLEGGERAGARLTYAELDRQARAIAAYLESQGAAGERALLIYPSGLDFIGSFFGCLYSGVIAVPVYPPDPARLDQSLPKLLGVAGDAQATIVLTTSAVLSLAGALSAIAPQLAGLRWVATDRIPAEAGSEWKEHFPGLDDLAYLQYTSGSTRLPRGVRLTHGNLIHNSQGICRAFRLTPEDRAVIWLPMYHNLGLLGGVLQPFYAGISCVLLTPQAFLEKPIRWLRAITQYGATVSGGPNFAFDLCVQRIPPADREGLDLHTWSLAFNGAEPVRPETIERFCSAYGPYGFQKAAFYPCYGLAEATLMVTGGTRGAGVRSCVVDRKALESNRVLPADPYSATGQTLVSCGKPFPDQKVVSVHPEKVIPLGEGEVGELWVSGCSVAEGYWNRPEESHETFRGHLADGDGPYLRTGDLGFLDEGDCFITGRLKDLIIIRGHNHYPQDIEATVWQTHPALAPSGGAAFSIDLEGEERLVVVQEILPQVEADYDEVARTIRRAVSEEHGLQVHTIALTASGTISRTVSGKIQRSATRKALADDSLPIIYRSSLNLEATAPSDPARPDGARDVQDTLLAAALQALGPEGALDVVVGMLGERVGRILHIPPAAIERMQPLTSLGLDSIAAVELGKEFEESLGIAIPMERLVQGASLDEIARMLVDRLAHPRPAASTASPPPAEPAAGGEAAGEHIDEQPLSYGQKALWLYQRMNPGSVAHNIAYAARIPPETDSQAVREAFAGLVDRHPMLRTTFREVDGQPVACVHERGSYTWIVEDTNGWSSAQFEERLAAEVNHAFDLENGPLLRITVLRQAGKCVNAIISMHHIITDMWSMAILLHEMGELFTASLEGRPPSLRALTASYADHVQWQERMVASEEGETHRRYWERRLAPQLGGELPALILPTDHPRPAQPAGYGAAYRICPPGELTRSIRQLAQSRGADLFATLLAVFDVLLHRYSGQTDILVGCPKAGRNRRNALTVGYFINPVILRADLSGDPLFTDLLERVYSSVRADFEHDAYPYPLVVERVKPGRGSLFQVLYSWQKTTRLVDSKGIGAFALNAEGVLELGKLRLESLPLRARVSPTDLALLVVEDGDELVLTVEYSRELFEPETIERFLGHYQTILTAVAANPAQRISRLPMLAPKEREMILNTWSGAGRSTPEPGPMKLVHEWIQDQAQRLPEQVAVSTPVESLTYAELQRKVDDLAAWLRSEGLVLGTPVGVCLERSPESVISLLGILKAGGVYLPLDPDYPPERLQYMLSDAGAGFVITRETLLPNLQGSQARPVCLDVGWEGRVPAGAEAIPVRKLQPDDVCYLLYTSGSTGWPKGVLVGHGVIARHCRSMLDYYSLTRADRVLQFAAPTFDASLEQIFTCLMAGARLELRDNDLWDPADFSARLAGRGITVVNLPPAYWRAWTLAEAAAGAAAGVGEKPPPANPQLRLVILGGDVVQPDILALWQQTRLEQARLLQAPLKNARLINAYGPTEATITATVYDIPPDTDFTGIGRVPIGKPVNGRMAYILDAEGEPVPAGVPGELFLGGVGLALGYHGQPELTQRNFIPNPFHDLEGGRIYRTGDLARWRRDGNIEFLGRVDHQVKIRGIRIELEEIEAVLKQHPSIFDAAITVQAGDLGEQLIACVVPEKGKVVAPAVLAAYLARQLPAYMVPAAYILLEALPLTPGGKPDREAIAQLAKVEKDSTRPVYTAPRTLVEKQVAEVWKGLLCVERVGVYDNFFNLGGHSLLAAQLVSRLREQFHVEVPLQQVFAYPTVAGQALMIAGCLAGQLKADDLEAMLADLEDMPDDRAADQLHRESESA